MPRPWYILGCGAMGGLYAGQLSRAGIPVVMLPRTAPAPGALFELEISGLSNSRHSLPWQTRQSPEPIERLLVFTKAYDVAPALAGIAHRLTQDSQVILMANGMGYADELQLPGLAPAFGTSTQGAHRGPDGQVRHAGHGHTLVGMPGVRSVPEWFAPLQHAIADCNWEADINAALWRKLAINCAINPLTALNGCPNGQLAHNPQLSQQVSALCREITAVARAAGQTLDRLEQQVSGIIHATANNRCSMLQDVERNQRTEIDYINGFLVQQARRLGIDAPLNEALWQTVRELHHDEATD